VTNINFMDKLKVLSEINVENIFSFQIINPVYLDFTSANKELKNIDLNSEEFVKYVFDKIGNRIGIGKYDEKRTIYDRSELFSGDKRNIHLGIDLWTKEETPIFAILDGKVHSFNDNNNFGDYGPTIILEHIENGIKFFTLYGHLSKDSLNDKLIGKKIKKGEKFAKIGSYDVNGNWPPHLHFQIIFDMENKKGDYYGVTSDENKDKYLKNCPDPNILLRIKSKK
ncbi:MAG: peptidoglycan DD-metalloendopeptidase family protein, partial [Nanoarchaeota archaeon]